MTRARLLERMRAHPYAVQCSVSADGRPQAATVGVAISDDLEIVFDTLQTTRKWANATRRPRMALVMGSLDASASWGLQIEGPVDEPTGRERERLLQTYLKAFPDGVDRQAWPGLTYLRVRPEWIRSLDYGVSPPEIVEYDVAGLAALR